MLRLGGGLRRGGLGCCLLLAHLLGALGGEDALHPLVLEALRLDLLESLDLGLGRLLRGGVGVALVLQLVLLVLELLAQLLEICGRDGVLVHRRRRAVRRRGDQLIGDDLVGRGLRPFEDRDRPGARCHVAVDSHLLRLGAQLVDLRLQLVVLRLQLGDLLVELVELEAGLGPGRRGGVGAVAGGLDLGSRLRRGVVVALRASPRRRGRMRRSATAEWHR